MAMSTLKELSRRRPSGLARLRLEAGGLTRTELARRVGVSVAALCYAEQRRGNGVGMKVLSRLSDALGCGIGECMELVYGRMSDERVKELGRAFRVGAGR